MNDNNIPEHLRDDPMAPYNSEADPTILYPEEVVDEDDFILDEDDELYEI